MEDKDKAILKGILEKKRNCVALTRDEQIWADNVLGKLLEKKFKNQVFIQKTGDEVREFQKNVGKPKDVQPEGAIADERSKFHTKDSKIENDDPSGKVKEVEEGDNVNVDEKDGDKAAEQVNASDIINADNDDEQRKPVFKLGDPVIKEINGRKYVGLIVKYYEEHGIAQIKWANGTFSNTKVEDLELLTKAYGKEKDQIEPPIAAASKKDVKKPGTDVDPENVGLKPGATDKKVIKADAKPADAEDPKEEAAEEATEDPKEEAAETPEQEAAEEGQEQEQEPEVGTEDYKNSWMARCMKSAGENADVEKADCLCSLAYGKMAKSNDGVVKLSVEEIKADNPKLAKSMEANGYTVLNVETKKCGTAMPMAKDKAEKPVVDKEGVTFSVEKDKDGGKETKEPKAPAGV